tara:strand:+ start:333 stop:632 length:300 start_codon:yes stop_codon:yes gene_type:complete
MNLCLYKKWYLDRGIHLYKKCYLQYMIQLNKQLKISIVIVIAVGYILYDQKPTGLFTTEGKFKDFGLSQDQTPFPFFLVLFVVGFISYYGLLLKEGKYV